MIDFEELKRLNYQNIKIGFPVSEQDAEGSESLWIMIPPEQLPEYEAGAYTGPHFGILANDSLVFPNIEGGAIVPYTLKGMNYRPVSDYEYLEALNYLKCFKYEALPEVAAELKLDPEQLQAAYNDAIPLDSATINALMKAYEEDPDEAPAAERLKNVLDEISGRGPLHDS